MELRLTDLKCLTAGKHPFRDGTITLRSQHIEMLKEDPNTIFNVIRSQPIAGKIRYVIGTAKA
ncbi:hypothetical protein ABIB95_003441 [Bradyrhizobium sp. LA2.1]